jgi:hypothetical protein
MTTLVDLPISSTDASTDAPTGTPVGTPIERLEAERRRDVEARHAARYLQWRVDDAGSIVGRKRLTLRSAFPRKRLRSTTLRRRSPVQPRRKDGPMRSSPCARRSWRGRPQRVRHRSQHRSSWWCTCPATRSRAVTTAVTKERTPLDR